MLCLAVSFATERDMLRSVAVAAFCMVFSIGKSIAADGVSASGVGTATCGQYMSTYKKSPSEADAVFLSWVDGFYSGMNIGALENSKPIRNLGQSDERNRLLHAYCDQHPLQDVGQAAVAIYRSFPLNRLPKR